MEIATKTNDNREVDLDLGLINIYARRWKPQTDLLITVTRVSEDNDPLRRAYFAGVLRPYGEYLGYDAHEQLLLHRQLKILWFKVQPDERGIHRDVPHVFDKKKSKLHDDEKRAFVNWVVRMAAHDGCYIGPRGG